MGRWKHALAALCALSCTWMMGCGSGTVPDALIHVWRTDAPAYRERHLEIQKDWIVFGIGGMASDSFPIVGIDSEPSGSGSTRYTIRYRVDDGAQFQFRVLLTPGTPDLLRIEHTDEVWRADSAPGLPKQGART